MASLRAARGKNALSSLPTVDERDAPGVDSEVGERIMDARDFGLWMLRDRIVSGERGGWRGLVSNFEQVGDLLGTEVMVGGGIRGVESLEVGILIEGTYLGRRN